MADSRGKVALILGAIPSSGGGYVFERKLLSLLRGLSVEARFDLRVFLSNSKGNPRELVGDSWLPLFVNADSAAGAVNDFLKPFLSRWRRRVTNTQLEKYLSNEGTSLVFFGSMNRLMDTFRDLPFFLTVWDLGHRDLVDFPEFRGREWVSREARFWHNLPRASHVFVDSIATSRRIVDVFGVSAQRVSCTGLLFEGFDEGTEIDESVVPNQPYFLYPAKMWAHKNHLMLLEAFSQVVVESPDTLLVFTGAPDGDFADRLEKHIDRLGLQNSVFSLGFVDENKLIALIRSARGLVMPSLLGPTNIPPLQALALGTPALVSEVHRFDDGLNDSMIVLPSDAPIAWAQAMIALVRNPVAPEPVRFSNDRARAEVHKALSDFFRRERLWR